ncbi:Uncharacterized aminotransferase YodT [Serendipita indica DSM 11827]|nr:Uncharacterized aminotransferase YodT [Serendipita indica DSM 11827]
MSPISLDSTQPTAVAPSKGTANTTEEDHSNVKELANTSNDFATMLHRVPWTPPIAVSAQGVYISLENGETLIDGVGGAAVTCIGMGNQKVTDAIQQQLQKLSYVYNVQLLNEPSLRLADRLIASSGGAFAQCFFVSGGSEAMEAVIKLARQYYVDQSPPQPQRKFFISRRQSYHGNTLGALQLSYHPARRAPYEVLLNHDAFHHVSPAYYKRYASEGESEEEYAARLVKEVEDKMEELGPQNVIAFVAEPVVGATQGHGILLIYDEVMCGMGRMGSTYHAWQSPNSYTDGIPPDIQAVAKGLGGGYGSIGAVFLNHRVAEGLRSGSNYLQHGHTYQAHPLAVAASLAVQDVIEEQNLLERAHQVGIYLERRLRDRLVLSPNAICKDYVFDIRGGGCFWAIELQVPDQSVYDKWFIGRGKERLGGRVQAQAMKNGLVIIGMSGGIDGAKGDHLILAPAYNMTDAEIDEVVDKLVSSIEQVLNETVLSE